MKNSYNHFYVETNNIKDADLILTKFPFHNCVTQKDRNTIYSYKSKKMFIRIMDNKTVEVSPLYNIYIGWSLHKIDISLFKNRKGLTMLIKNIRSS